MTRKGEYDGKNASVEHLNLAVRPDQLTQVKAKPLREMPSGCRKEVARHGTSAQHSRTEPGQRERARAAGCPAGQCRREAESAAALRRARTDFPETCGRALPSAQVDHHADHPGHLLRDALAQMGSRYPCARSGRPYRHGQPPLLFLLHRDLAAGILLCRWPARHVGRRPVPRHLDRRARLVRLHLSADRVDRPFHRGRTVLAG